MSGPPVRKPDPNRFKHIDLLPDEARNDVDFMRAVQDLEDQQQNRAGWLFARGAFDKGDLLYLRDEEEKRRHIELDQRESERSQFLTQRAQAEEEEAKKAATAAARAAATRKALQAEKEKKRLLVPMVRLKPTSGSGSGLALESEGSGALQSEGGPAAKRARPDSSDAAGGGNAAGPERQGEAGPGPSGSRGKEGEGAQLQGQEGGSDEGGLAGLLGGYGSDSDPGSQGDRAASGKNLQQQQPDKEQGNGKARDAKGAAGELSSAAQLPCGQ